MVCWTLGVAVQIRCKISAASAEPFTLFRYDTAIFICPRSASSDANAAKCLPMASPTAPLFDDFNDSMKTQIRSTISWTAAGVPSSCLMDTISHAHASKTFSILDAHM